MPIVGLILKYKPLYSIHRSRNNGIMDKGLFYSKMPVRLAHLNTERNSTFASVTSMNN